jgi:hypothetical protein
VFLCYLNTTLTAASRQNMRIWTGRKVILDKGPSSKKLWASRRSLKHTPCCDNYTKKCWNFPVSRNYLPNASKESNHFILKSHILQTSSGLGAVNVNRFFISGHLVPVFPCIVSTPRQGQLDDWMAGNTRWELPAEQISDLPIKVTWIAFLPPGLIPAGSLSCAV